MNLRRPLIGITPGYDEASSMMFVKNGYYKGINQAGGLSVAMPLTWDESILDELVQRCDGFLLCGGPDIDPELYGEENMPYNGEISPYRDMMEMHIVRKAVECSKPVFGICRGIQMMNVAMGGTLYQDIRSQVKDREVIQHSQSAPKWYPTHEILIEKDSKVWKSFMKSRIRVNSFHHQAVKDVAPGFAVTSRSSDGVIESIEYKGNLFAVGVQWHPELMWEKDQTYLRLFEEFVRQAAG